MKTLQYLPGLIGGVLFEERSYVLCPSLIENTVCLDLYTLRTIRAFCGVERAQLCTPERASADLRSACARLAASVLGSQRWLVIRS